MSKFEYSKERHIKVLRFYPGINPYDQREYQVALIRYKKNLELTKNVDIRHIDKKERSMRTTSWRVRV